jgi:hypothetical protein
MTIASKVSDLLNALKDAKTTARRPCHNDVYIVEFPKSGITWLSCLLANAALLESGRREVASFTAAHQFVPDIHVTRHIGQMPYHTPPVRLIKSHAHYNRNYVFVIYLVRHPLGVMKSYFRFLRDVNGDIYGGFDDFCRSDRWGVNAWRRHVNSWLIGKVTAQRLHLVRYEDLTTNTTREVHLIARNFGWNLQDHSIERAVALSSMTEMQASERLYQSRNPRYPMMFVGGLNDFAVSPETVAFIQSKCETELTMLGYEA